MTQTHMTDPTDHVLDLVVGRWRSQTLHAGVDLGVFETVEERPKHAVEITDQLDVDEAKGYRLLRALSSLDLLEESDGRRFSITPAGSLLQAEHPGSLRGFARLEEGPTHYAIWKHLPDIVREGEPNGFQREFGHDFLDHRRTDGAYAQVFDEGLSSLSHMESEMVTHLLEDVAFSEFGSVCDVGGGSGHLLCTLLQDAPSVEGTVLELPHVVEADTTHWPERMGLTDRVAFVAGDFFEAVPTADAYLLKHILHDWDDDECVEILSTIRAAAPPTARLFVCEFVVPGPDRSHIAKLYDVHMMVATTGRERTAAEYIDLFEAAGFEHVDTHRSEGVPLATVEGRPIDGSDPSRRDRR